METKETRILQKIIERWIDKNLDSVLLAQRLAKKINEYGLIDLSRTMPFQILPTEFSDADGDNYCKLHLNIESPIYGFFVVEITREDCIVTCPQVYKNEAMRFTHEECEKWIDELNNEMDVFYQISSAAAAGESLFCQMALNDLLNVYNGHLAPKIKKIKSIIEENPNVAISSGKFYSLVKNAKQDYLRALLIPSAWIVLKSLDDLPEQDESIDQFIDESATEKLATKLNEFFREEAYLAAPIYLAQRIILQSGLSVKGKSKSEECEMNATQSEELGEFVLPPIDILEFITE